MAAARPARVRAVPARLDAEQAEERELASLLAQIRMHERAGDASGDDSGAEDDESESGEAEEEDSGPEEEEERKWSTTHRPVTLPRFRAPVPFPVPPADCDSPLDFFRLFFPDDFLSYVATQTSEYIEQKHDSVGENSHPNTRAAAAAEAAVAEARPHDATTPQEIRALFGCLIYMGIVCVDDTRGYWERETRQAFVADCFPRDRFILLLRSLRFDPQLQSVGDRLQRLRTIIHTIQENALLYFYPGQDVCVDEAMVAFKGRSIMRQHITKKKSPTGFKVWMLVDVQTNYVYAFDVYTGAKGVVREAGAAKRVVLDLAARLTQKHHVITLDGFFTSVLLLEELLTRDTYAVGTTRHNRKHFPTVLLEEVKGCARGEWAWRQDGRIVVVCWMDKKPVNLISSCCDPEKKEEINRRRGREVFQVSCPEVVNRYTKNMRGVDIFAQRQSYNKIGRKSRKWFYSLAWFFVDVAIHNAFILYQQKHKRKRFGEKDFRLLLMAQMVGDFSARKHRSAKAAKRKRSGLHQLMKRDASGTCTACRVRLSSGHHNRRTSFACEECDLYLCLPDCYNKHIQSLAGDTEDIAEEE
jgi:hypothetical protein